MEFVKTFTFLSDLTFLSAEVSVPYLVPPNEETVACLSVLPAVKTCQSLNFKNAQINLAFLSRIYGLVILESQGLLALNLLFCFFSASA